MSELDPKSQVAVEDALRNDGAGNERPAVAVENLVKRYGAVPAVDGLSFIVAAGEIFALLGPNGAGKTTTVEILEGYSRPDSGSVRVLGLDPSSQGTALKPRIGVMLQESGLYPAMTAREALTLFGHYYPDARPAGELLELVDLREAADTPYRRLSGGQKQRLSLALALVGRPALLFLDEPTAGLDPQARRLTWQVITALRDQGVTVVLTTHYLEEAERLADRVAIIDRGRLMALDTPANLLQATITSIHLRTVGSVPLAVLSVLPAVERAEELREAAYHLQSRDPPSALVQVTAALRDRGVQALEVRVGRRSLEDVFLELTGRELGP